MARKYLLKKYSVSVLILSFIVAGVVFMADAREAGKLTIERVWEEGSPQSYHYSYALVSWENTTQETFKQITIKAIASSPGGKMIGENTRSFFAHSDGPLVPGFTGTLKIPVNLGKSNFSHMKCFVAKAY